MQYGWIFAICTFLILAIKVFINWNSYGTVDITSWIEFGQYVSTKDIFSIYEMIPLYNHPPLMSLWLRLLMWLTADHPSYIPQVFRMVPICADVGSAMILWKISHAYFPYGSAVLRATIAAASPILILVSGFHGNTDPIFGFLILLAGYLLAVRKLLVPSALALALAVNIKIVPILAAPAFFFWIRSSRERLRFVACFGGAALLGYAAHLLTVPRFLLRNVFLYTGPGGIWGIGNLVDNNGIYRVAGIVLLGLSTLYFAWLLGRRSPPGVKLEEIPLENGLNLFRALALAFVSFLALTPGFGVQYLSWLASLVVFLSIPLALLYTLSASAFLVMVYTHWCCGIRWGAEDGWTGLWPPGIETMGYIAWVCTLLLLAHNLAVVCGAYAPLLPAWRWASREIGNIGRAPG
jgi:hypothetical protein